MGRKKRNKRHIELYLAYTIQELATTIAFSNVYEDIIHLFDEIHEQIAEDGIRYEEWERRLSDWAKQHVVEAD